MKRAFITGIIFSIALSILDPFLINTQAVGLTSDFLAAGAYFFLFIAIIVTGILSFVNRKFLLSSSELVLIFMMVSAACVIPSWGVIGNLFPAIAGVNYFEFSPDACAGSLLNRMGPWILNTNRQAVAFFYESRPVNAPVYYLSWLKPLLFWLGLILTFTFLSICLAVMLRKQWVENERLTFPLAVMPLEVTRKHSEKERLPSIFKNPLMWAGFILAFVLVSLNGLTCFLPTFRINFARLIPIFRRTDDLVFLFSFTIIAFAYLLPVNIAFSLFIFHILAKIQTGVSNMSGYSLPGGNEVFGGSSAATSFQGGGAMITLFLYIIFLSRRHLADIFLKAAGIREEIDDSSEMLSYKTCFLGWIISVLILSGFLRCMGMPLFVIMLFIFFIHVVFVSLGKIIAQAGIGFARPQCTPPDFTAYTLPPGLIGPYGYSSLGMQYVWSADIRTTVLSSTLNALKMNERRNMAPRIIFWGIISSVVVAYIVSAMTTLFIGYKYGAINSANQWFYGPGMPSAIERFISGKVCYPLTREIILPRMIFAGLGGLVMLILIALQHKFLWWPLHYIGFPIADSWVMKWAWFSIFIAWFIKVLLLKYAGMSAYRKSIPFFIGLLLGVMGASCIWIPLNLIHGHPLNSIMFGVP